MAATRRASVEHRTRLTRRLVRRLYVWSAGAVLAGYAHNADRAVDVDQRSMALSVLSNSGECVCTRHASRGSSPSH